MRLILAGLAFLWFTVQPPVDVVNLIDQTDVITGLFDAHNLEEEVRVIKGVRFSK